MTSSWVEDSGNLKRYVSCVGNFDAATDLLVTWFIAGPFTSYVPATESTETPRMSSDLNARPVNGCIKFGNLDSYTPAQFMGSAADEAENAHSNGCAGLTPSGGDSAAAAFLTDGWSDNVRVFFPSDPNNPHDTMLELTGTIGLTNVGEGNYESFFKYRAVRYKDRPEGQPDDVTVTPVFPYDTKKFFSAYYDTNKEAMSLGDDGIITFKVNALSALWRPVPAYYEFRDRQNRVLGAIPMPLLGTAGAN